MSKPSMFSVYLKRFREFYLSYRSLPTFETCKEIIGVQSKSAVHRFFQQLLEYGFITKKEGSYYPNDKLVGLPLFNSVQAGIPVDVRDPQSEIVAVDTYLIDNHEQTVMLKVSGESMIDAGIYEGDVILVDVSKNAKKGDIIVGVVDGEYTVKYLDYSKEDRPVLLPANNEFQPILPGESFSIYGVVVSSMRRYG